MMTTLTDRFYYIFDGRQQRTLVVDRRTGDLYARHDDDRARLMAYVAYNSGAKILRRFALWCASEAYVTEKRPTEGEMTEGRTPEDPAHVLAAIGEQMMRGAADPHTVEAARTEVIDAVALASTVGLAYQQPDSAALLVAYACTHADPMEAALDAAHMSERWAEFRADPYQREEAVTAMRQRHIDYFLDRLSTA